MKRSRLLGEFLVANGALTSNQLDSAVREQKRRMLDHDLFMRLRSVLSRRELARLLRRYRENDESLLQALVALGYFSRNFFEKNNPGIRNKRVPLGQIIVELGYIEKEAMTQWLVNFQGQKFDPAEIKPILTKCRLFRSLDESHLMRLARAAHHRFCEAGEILYEEGASADSLFVLESGLLRLSLASNNQAHDLIRVHPGEACGLHNVLNSSVHSERATAVLKSMAWKIPRETIRELMGESGVFAREAATNLSRSMGRIMTGMKGKDSNSMTGNIHTVFFPSDATSESYAWPLADALLNESRGSVLILSSIPIAVQQETPPIKIRDMGNVEPRMLGRRGDRAIYSYYSPGMEFQEETDELSRVLREQSRHYSAVILFATPGTKNFLRFASEVSRRTVTMVNLGIPRHVALGLPGRDRVYVVADENPEKTRRRFNEVKKVCPRTLAPLVINRGGRDRIPRGIARFLVGRTFGLALGGGGARGMAHIGVMHVLHERGIEIDAISGASAGAMLGAARCFGSSPSRIEEFFREQVMYAKPFGDFTIPVQSITRGKRGTRILRKYTGEAMIYDLEIPLFPIATRMRDGAEIVLKGCEVWKACYASGSAPGLVPPGKYDGEDMLDGGVVNNVPASVLKDFGIDFIVSVNISIEPARAPYNPKRIMSNLTRFIDIMMHHSASRHAEHTDVEITPRVDAFSVFDWHRGDELIEIGRTAAELKYPEIAYLLGEG